MPPIAKNGRAALAARVLDEPEPDPGPALFGRRLPDRADADVVDRLRGGGIDLILGVRGEADDRLRPEHLAGLGDGHVVLAEVDAVGVADAGEVGIVVDDEEGAVGVAEAAEGAGRAGDRVLVELLLAELDDVGAAGQRRLQQRSGSSPRGSASQTK